MKMPTNRIKSIYDDFRENADFPAKALYRTLVSFYMKGSEMLNKL